VWGVLPIEPGVSWETHLAAALIGIALALALRRLDISPRRRYSWEDEETRNADPQEDPSDREQGQLGESESSDRSSGG